MSSRKVHGVNRLLSYGLFALQRLVVKRHTSLAAGVALLLLSLGVYRDVSFSAGDALPLSLLAGLALLVIFRLLAARGSAGRGHEPSVGPLARVELGACTLSVIYLAIQATGGPGSPLQPLAYLAVAVLVGLNERWPAALITGVAMGFQIVLHLAGGGSASLMGPLAVQLLYLAGFALAGMVFLQIDAMHSRREHDTRLRQTIHALHREAREFRLISSALSSEERRDRAADEAKLALGSVEAIHQGMYFILMLLKRSLDLQTCVLLWLDRSEQRLHIKELVTDTQRVREVPISSSAGVLGGVVKNRILLNLRRLPRGARGIPYYDGPVEVQSFVGVPVEENGHLRGVLCADRKDDRPFSPHEEKLLKDASLQILRSIQTERVFAAVERSKYEHERFYRASTLLNQALTLSQVYDTAFAAADQIAPFDLGALTLYDPARRRHHIVRVRGENAESFEGQSFGANAGLVSMVVKNKHLLPAGDALRERDTVVFTRRMRLKGIESLVVLPLIVQDETIGTFVLASRGRVAFAKKVREMLGVIANQVAVAMENAKMYKKMEEMATTDGLTGLPNHRTFQARLTEMLQRAERHGKVLSVVLTDIDKFKLVNDNHGHPVGDVVLKRVSKVLADQARKVDVVARYGGEEFVMVLEQTDTEGAFQVCERIRQEVASQVMSSEQGPFRVSISLGIATYPQDGHEKAELVERADQALYTAKETGRNRTVRYCQMKKVKQAAAGN